MKQPKFDTIIKLNQIKRYLSTQDLIMLSLCCKQFRELLSPEVFSSFNFKEFAIHGNYKRERISKEDYEYKEIEELFGQSRDNGKDGNEDSFDIEKQHVDAYNSNNDEEAHDIIKEINGEVEDNDSCEDFGDEEENVVYIRNSYRPLPKSYLASREKFQSNLKQIPYQPTKLILFDVDDYDYLLYDLPNMLTNLHSLVIKSSSIQFSAFQYLLDNLTRLEVIELADCNLNMQRSDKNDYAINWPLNLKKLVIENNLVGFTSYEDDYTATDAFGCLDFEHSYLSLEPNRLPNLHTLCIETRDPGYAFGAGYGGKYLEFLKANSHVKKLQIGFDSFYPEFFEIISKFINLAELSLSIECVENINEFECIKCPTLANLKYLSLTIYKDLTILPIIAAQFSNVTKLSLITKFWDLENLNLLPSNIQSFKSLKSLKLKIFAEYKLNNLNFSNINNLTSLEILWKNLDDVEGFLNNLETCPNLKNAMLNVIKFEERELSSKLKLELNETQRLLPFPHRVLFYKINQ